MSDDDAYRGALGAFPYAARTSESLSLQVYVAVATLASLATVLFFVLALIGFVASTVNQSPAVTLVRGFLLLLMAAVLLPIAAPVLLVARRHRLGTPVDPRYDRALAAGGYVFLATLYTGLLASVPQDLQTPTGGPLSPLIEWLYALPQPAGLVPPALGAGLIWLLHRRFGHPDDG
jgi:hypothetical protein